MMHQACTSGSLGKHNRMSERRPGGIDRLIGHGLLFTLLLITPLLYLSGCGSGQTDVGQSTSNNAAVSLNISMPQKSAASASTVASRFWATLPRWLPTITDVQAASVTDLSAIRVEVTAPDLQPPLSKSATISSPASGQVITLDLDVPMGTGRVFTVDGLNLLQQSIFRGQRSAITLSAGQATSVDITLAETPVVTSISPAEGQTEVPVTLSIQLTFSTPIKEETLTPATFVITGPTASAVAGVTCNNPNPSCTHATVTLSSPLAPGETYALAVQGGITDLQGVPLSLDLPGTRFPIHFTTTQHPTGTVTGTITEATGNKLAGATVSVNGTSLSITAGSDGSFTLTQVPQGLQTLTVSAASFQTKHVPVRVVPSTSVSAGTIALTRITIGTVIGTVTDATGNKLAGATVSVNGTKISTPTGSDGSFTLTQVPQGPQTLTVSASGFNSATTSVTVMGGQTVSAGTITLTLGTGTVTGTVDGCCSELVLTPLVGATVSVNGTSISTTTGSDGSFTLTGEIGRAHV